MEVFEKRIKLIVLGHNLVDESVRLTRIKIRALSLELLIDIGAQQDISRVRQTVDYRNRATLITCSYSLSHFFGDFGHHGDGLRIRPVYHREARNLTPGFPMLGPSPAKDR